MQSEAQQPATHATAVTAQSPMVTDPPIGKMAGALVALGVVGLALVWLITGMAERGELRGLAVTTGLIVVGASLVGLMPLVLTRHADALTKHVTGRMGHIAIRLFLTAGGLVTYLFFLPEPQRLSAGLIALGWYVLSWGTELFFLAPTRPHAAT